MEPRSETTADESEPLAPETALQQLDDETFLAFVTALWGRRGWTVAERRDTGPWYVDLLAHGEWPTEQQALLRVQYPESERSLSSTDVRHFIRTVQQTAVDRATLITAGTVATSVRTQAEEFGIDVVDRSALLALVDDTGSRDLLAEQVGRPVEPAVELTEHVPEPLVDALERSDAAGRTERFLSKLLPPDPTKRDLARLTFAGFRVALVTSTVLFVLAFASLQSAVLFWLVLGCFLLSTYGGLLPLMAADIYLVRRAPATSWTPRWTLLAGFLLVPVMLLAGGLYWYRRRRRTPRGEDGLWQSAAALW